MFHDGLKRYLCLYTHVRFELRWEKQFLLIDYEIFNVFLEVHFKTHQTYLTVISNRTKKPHLTKYDFILILVFILLSIDLIFITFLFVFGIVL